MTNSPYWYSLLSMATLGGGGRVTLILATDTFFWEVQQTWGKSICWKWWTSGVQKKMIVCPIRNFYLIKFILFIYLLLNLKFGIIQILCKWLQNILYEKMLKLIGFYTIMEHLENGCHFPRWQPNYFVKIGN